MELTRWTIALCTDCGYPVVGAHDCARQIAENKPGFDALGRLVFYVNRGELIARLAKAKE